MCVCMYVCGYHSHKYIYIYIERERDCIIYKHTYRGIQNISNNKHALAARTAVGLRRRRGVQGCPGGGTGLLKRSSYFTYNIGI